MKKVNKTIAELGKPLGQGMVMLDKNVDIVYSKRGIVLVKVNGIVTYLIDTENSQFFEI